MVGPRRVVTGRLAGCKEELSGLAAVEIRPGSLHVNRKITLTLTLTLTVSRKVTVIVTVTDRVRTITLMRASTPRRTDRQSPRDCGSHITIKLFVIMFISSMLNGTM
jgi:hypothetical protein